MLIQVYDSTVWSDIPRNTPQGLLAYSDGAYVFPSDKIKDFPNVVKVWWITVTGRDLMADVVDCENGDATVSGAIDWVLRKRAMGVAFPIVYANDSTWTQLKAGFQAINQILPSWWEANPDGVATLNPEAYAKQYLWPPQSGGHYDISIAPYDPPPTPDPIPVEELEDMGLSIVVGPDGRRHVAGVRNDEGHKNHALILSETAPGSNQFSAQDVTDIILNTNKQTYTVMQ